MQMGQKNSLNKKVAVDFLVLFFPLIYLYFGRIKTIDDQ